MLESSLRDGETYKTKNKTTKLPCYGDCVDFFKTNEKLGTLSNREKAVKKKKMVLRKTAGTARGEFVKVVVENPEERTKRGSCTELHGFQENSINHQILCILEIDVSTKTTVNGRDQRPAEEE